MVLIGGGGTYRASAAHQSAMAQWLKIIAIMLLIFIVLILILVLILFHDPNLT